MQKIFEKAQQKNPSASDEKQAENNLNDDANDYTGYYKNKTFKDTNYDKYYNTPVKDKYSKESIPTLHPTIREDTKAALNEIYEKYGIILRITKENAYRSDEDQAKLYAIGRSGPNDKRLTVTDAPPGRSNHNYALAFDVYAVTAKGQYVKLTTEEYENKIVSIMKKYNFEWGGKFTKVDPPHFERIIKKFNSYTKYMDYLENKNKINETDGKYIIIDQKAPRIIFPFFYLFY